MVLARTKFIRQGTATVDVVVGPIFHRIGDFSLSHQCAYLMILLLIGQSILSWLMALCLLEVTVTKVLSRAK